MTNPLNLPQRRAVESKASVLRIVAGPGTGKTTVLVERIANYLTDGMISGYNVLALTFTRKAANEMMDRLRQTCHKGDVDKITIGTFHAVCLRMINQWPETLGYKSDVEITVLDEADRMDLLIHLAKRLEPDEKKAKKLAKSALQVMTDPQYAGITPDDAHDEINLIYLYHQELLRMNSLDYDMILDEALRLLKTNVRARDEYRNQWRHVFVDEFQDTDDRQLELLKILHDVDHSLTVVGDPDQALYAWRGARPENMVDFDQHFPGCETVTLDINYRSTPQIVEASQRLIEHNTKRLESEQRAARPRTSSLRYITYRAENEEQQAKTVVGFIYSGSKSYAILARTNFELREIALALDAQEVEYQLVTPYDCWKSTAVKRCLDMLRLVVNPYDDRACENLLRYYNACSPTRLQEIRLRAVENDQSLFQAVGSLDFPEQTTAQTRCFYDQVADVIPAFVKKHGVREALKDRVISWFYEHGMFEKDVEVRQATEWLEQIPEGFTDIRQFLRWCATRKIEDAVDEDGAAVKLMTVHTAKGLEFDTVILINCIEGLFPMTREDSDLEEERRVFFVGMTRARNTLILSYPLEEFKWKMIATEPSRFLREMEK